MSTQKLNSMITNKAKRLELIDALTELEIIMETRNEINDNKMLQMIENVLKELKEDKDDELKNKLMYFVKN